MKQFTPLGKNVLIRPTTAAPVRTFGVINPSAQEEKPTRGIVVNMGPTTEDSRIVPGVEIGFRKYSGVDLVVDGEMLLLLRSDEIAGIWEEEDSE